MSSSRLFLVLGFLTSAWGYGRPLFAVGSSTDLERDLAAGTLVSAYQRPYIPSPAPKIMAQLGEVVLECAARPYSLRYSTPVISNCSADRLSVSYTAKYSLAKLCVESDCNTAVAFERQVASNDIYFPTKSVADLAIYDASGSLIGVVQNIEAPDNTVLDDIARLENVEITPQN